MNTTNIKSDITVDDLINAIESVYPGQSEKLISIAYTKSISKNKETDWYEVLAQLLLSTGFEVEFAEVFDNVELTQSIINPDKCIYCTDKFKRETHHIITSIYASSDSIMGAYYCLTCDCELETEISLDELLNVEQAKQMCDYILSVYSSVIQQALQQCQYLLYNQK